jgi:hypothetical protein
LRILHEILSLENQANMLGDIRAMQVVVVFNRSLVFVVNLSDELEELVMVDSLQQVVVLE